MPQRLGLVGLGLIGGSIAAAVRKAGLPTAIVGVDRPSVLDEAWRRGLIDEGRGDIETLGDTDLIVLATPVPEVVQSIARLGAATVRVPVTDVASTKREVVAAAARARIDFIGGHPMAGSERSGLGHADASLFHGRSWFLVTAGGSDRARAEVEALVATVGATARFVSAETHDRAMAYVSHLPQLVAVALAETAGAALGPEELAMAGRAFTDMTRLASSPPDLWHGILASNDDFVGEALRAMRATLAGLEQNAGDPTQLAESFRRASLATAGRREDET